MIIDHKQMGVGGDDSWSPSVHDEFLIKDGYYQWDINISSLNWYIEKYKFIYKIKNKIKKYFIFFIYINQ